MSMDKPIQQERFMRLFVEHERDLLRYVLAVVPSLPDARDIVQETAVALWRKMADYDPARPFLPWACRFASIEIRRFLRQAEQQRRLLDEQAVEALLARQEELLPRLTARRAYLRECLEELPDAQRQLVRGYYWDEQDVDALARQSGRTAEAIYKALQRIRQALSDCMNRKAREEGASA
jgi:RNA polymerase sigma-70 factor (ECF subfamily)